MKNLEKLKKISKKSEIVEKCSLAGSAPWGSKNYEKIGNMKGRNNIELSAKDRFPYINQFIIENYEI